MKVLRRLVKNNRTTKISLPKDFVEALGIEINEIVNVELVKGNIVISKIMKG